MICCSFAILQNVAHHLVNHGASLVYLAHLELQSAQFAKFAIKPPEKYQ